MQKINTKGAQTSISKKGSKDRQIGANNREDDMKTGPFINLFSLVLLLLLPLTNPHAHTRIDENNFPVERSLTWRQIKINHSVFLMYF